MNATRLGLSASQRDFFLREGYLVVEDVLDPARDFKLLVEEHGNILNRLAARHGEAGDIDTAVITLELEGGCIATIDNSRKAAYGYDQRVEVFGSKGVAWADNNTAHRTGLGTAQGMQSPKPLDFFMDRYVESYILELQAFVKSVSEGSEASVSGLDGRIPVVIGLAAKRSMEEGRPVRLAEIH